MQLRLCTPCCLSSRSKKLLRNSHWGCVSALALSGLVPGYYLVPGMIMTPLVVETLLVFTTRRSIGDFVGGSTLMWYPPTPVCYPRELIHAPCVPPSFPVTSILLYR